MNIHKAFIWCLSHYNVINQFQVTGLFLYPLKISENQRFSDVFRVYRKRPVAWNWLITFNFRFVQTRKSPLKIRLLANLIFKHISHLFLLFFNWDSLHARLNKPLRGMELQEKKYKKRLQYTENLFRKNLQLKDVC